MNSSLGASVLQLFGHARQDGPTLKLSELATQAKQQKQVSAPVPARVTSDVVQPPTEDELASVREFQETHRELENGILSPLSARALKWDAQSIEGARQRGLLFEGRFAESVMGDAQPRYAQFTDRHVAMLNAYHYASDLAAEAIYAADLWTSVNLDNAPILDDAQRASREVERNTSLLAVQFNFTTDVLVEAADGSMSMQAFEVRHDSFGLMLSVDATGTITLYDEAGTAYSAEEYAAASPDGIIPELLNRVAIKSGKLDGRF